MKFHPQRGMRERVILRLSRQRMQPDLFQAPKRSKVGIGLDISIVIPDESISQDRKIGRERNGDQRKKLSELAEDMVIPREDH